MELAGARTRRVGARKRSAFKGSHPLIEGGLTSVQHPKPESSVASSPPLARLSRDGHQGGGHSRYLARLSRDGHQVS